MRRGSRPGDGAVKRSDERRSLESIAPRYFSPELAGANELYHQHLRDAVIPPEGGESALEIGCGKGMWTSVLCERYDTVDVVDASASLLSGVRLLAEGKRATLATHLSLIEDFHPAPGQVWDHVYMTFILEHLLSPGAVLRKLKTMLRPGGRLFVTVPNARSVHRVVAVRMGLIGSVYDLSDNDRSLGHRRVYCAKRLGALLSRTGYRVTDRKSVGLKPLTLKQLEPLPPELIRAYCDSGDLCGAHGAYIALRATPAP